jgi:hypothetical protein
MRRVLRVQHYAFATEKAYCEWVRRFVKFHGMKSRADLTEGPRKVEEFLTHLAVVGQHPRSKVEGRRSKVEGRGARGERPTSNIQHPTSNVQHPRSRVEGRGSKGEGPTSNNEHRTAYLTLALACSAFDKSDSAS